MRIVSVPFQYVMPPSVRSSAEAIQIVLLHTLGDAFSPFILGAVSIITELFSCYVLHVYLTFCPTSARDIIFQPFDCQMTSSFMEI